MASPIPKKPSQRRRRNKPKSYGLAEPVQDGVGVPAPDLGLPEVHPMVEDLYMALTASVEAKYYSEADWQRVRLECFNINMHLLSGRVPGAQAWTAIQAGLNDLMVSPIEKRKLGIELGACEEDPDQVATISAMSDYVTTLKSA